MSLFLFYSFFFSLYPILLSTLFNLKCLSSIFSDSLSLSLSLHLTQSLSFFSLTSLFFSPILLYIFMSLSLSSFHPNINTSSVCCSARGLLACLLPSGGLHDRLCSPLLLSFFLSFFLFFFLVPALSYFFFVFVHFYLFIFLYNVLLSFFPSLKQLSLFHSLRLHLPLFFFLSLSLSLSLFPILSLFHSISLFSLSFYLSLFLPNSLHLMISHSFSSISTVSTQAASPWWEEWLACLLDQGTSYVPSKCGFSLSLISFPYSPCISFSFLSQSICLFLPFFFFLSSQKRKLVE